MLCMSSVGPICCDTRDCNPPGSSVHRISQARILEWVAISSSRGSSWPRNQTCVSCIFCIDRQILFTTEPPGKPGIGKYSSVQSLSRVSLRPHELQHARPPYPSPSPGVHSESHPSSSWCHSALSCSSSPSSPAPIPSQHQTLFQWVNSSHEVAKVLEFQL